LVSIGREEVEKADKIYKCVILKYQEITGEKIKPIEKVRFVLVLALGENDEIQVMKGGRASFEEMADAFKQTLKHTLLQIITGRGVWREE